MTEPNGGESPIYGTTPPLQPEGYPPSPGSNVPPTGAYVPPPGSYVPPPGSYVPPPGSGFPPPQGAYPYPPPPGIYFDPMAPYGRDPITGEPFSDKSKVVAGLLQLIGLFGLVGFGRIYLGETGLGVIQLVVGVLTCGIGAIIWGIVDAVLIFTGNVRDTAGRPLRDGT